MKVNEGLHIIGTGKYVPDNTVTNDDLSKIVDTNDEWIVTRTGIKRRHFVTKENNLDMSYEAAMQAIEDAGIDKNDIGAVVLSTVRADRLIPSEACMLQSKLGLSEDIPCFDINAACSGFIYGMTIARGLLIQNEKRYALVVGCEALSKLLDMSDRGTCILFGDGAGAAIVELSDKHMYYSVLGSRGNDKVLFCGNSPKEQYVRMDGSEVFRFAVSTVPRVVDSLLDKLELSADDIDMYVCHQANRRIIESVAKKLKQSMDKFYINLDEYGNTSSASIPIALREMSEKNILKPGMRIIMVGFGAGLTWGGAYIEW